MDYGFSVSTNILITSGILISLLLGIWMPPESEWADTQYWMVFYLFPIPILILALFLDFAVYQFESVEFYIERGSRYELTVLLTKIYNEPQLVIEGLCSNLMNQTKSDDGEKPSIKESLFSKDYSGSTSICIFLAIYN
jgi:hypothetical protein